MSSDRRAFEIFMRITQDGAFANLALKDGLSGCDPNEAARVSALVYTALEKLNRCDFMIDAFAKGRLQPKIRGVLRLAVCELFFMRTPDHAVCSNAVELTERIGKAGLKGYVNGVLRAMIRARDKGELPKLPSDIVERLRIETGYPAFMIKEYVSRFGEAFTEDMLKNRSSGVCVRGVYPHTPEETERLLSEKGLVFRKSEIVGGAFIIDGFGASIEEDAHFKSGELAVQSESAMLACVCLDPGRGARVLDACAAPGGKTAYISDLMERTGSITAWELHPHRAELIKASLKRLHVDNADVFVHDSSVPDGAAKRDYDAVICDVPCSGLGGGSKPDALYRRTDESIEELSDLQYRILEASSERVRDGGTLVYSTCTVSYRENEGVAERFLNAHPEFHPAPLTRYLSSALAERESRGMIQLFPHIDKTEGFFIAKFERMN